MQDLPSRNPMGGIKISLTNEEMILPKAAPIIIPMAISIILPRIANSLKSFRIFIFIL